MAAAEAQSGSLAGKVAVVTGAGTGIGRAAAVALAGAGARVALSGRRAGPLEEVAAELRQSGSEALVVTGDVSDPAAVEALFAAVRGRWGRVDILLNNAGINTRARNIHDISLEDWQTVVAVNLSGSFYCARLALESMRRAALGDDHQPGLRRREARRGHPRGSLQRLQGGSGVPDAVDQLGGAGLQHPGLLGLPG